MNINSDVKNFLRKIPLFNGVSEDITDEFARSLTFKEVLAGEILAEQGSPATHFYIVVSGELFLRASNENGRAVIVSRAGEGEIIGEVNVASDPSVSWNYDVVVYQGKGKILKLERTILESLMSRQDAYKLVLNLMQILSRRMMLAQKKLTLFALENVEELVIHELIHLSQTGKKSEIPEKSGVIITLPFQKELADRVGSIRETISKMLLSLARQGYIEFLNKRRTPRIVLLTDNLFNKFAHLS